jgi:hypothetical protein
MVSLLRADFIDQCAETAPGGGAAFGILAISVQNRRKRGRYRSGFTVIAFAEPSAAQDFCGNEISMADNWL